MFILRTCEWDLSPACRSRQLSCMPQKCDFFLTTAAATAAQTRVDVAKVICFCSWNHSGAASMAERSIALCANSCCRNEGHCFKGDRFLCSWNHSGAASMAECSIALCANPCCRNEGHCFKGDRFLFLEPLGLPPWQSYPLHYVPTHAAETRVIVSKVTGFCSWNHSVAASMAEHSIALCANSCCRNEGHCFKGDRFLFLEPLRGCLYGRVLHCIMCQLRLQKRGSLFQRWQVFVPGTTQGLPTW